MKFDMFYEVQCPKPWAPDHELRLYEETIEQARLADAAGFETWWQVEHNTTPEFSYSSAPDLWLSAVAGSAPKVAHSRPPETASPTSSRPPLKISSVAVLAAARIG